MTQLEYARQGIITEEMKSAAKAEGVAAEFILAGMAAGNIVICHNRKRLTAGRWQSAKACAPKSTPTSAPSGDDVSIDKELEKARVAVARRRRRDHGPLHRRTG